MKDGRALSLDILVLIVNSDKAPTADRLLKNLHSLLLYQFVAQGTATSEILDIFGLGGMDKSITVCVVPRTVSKRMLQELSEELSLKLPGMGIAFSLPVSGITEKAISLATEGCDGSPASSGCDEAVSEGVSSEVSRKEEVSKVISEIKHHLIVVAVNQGYSEEIVSAAKSAGATGGTVWSARRVGLEHALRLLGITVQGEQEIIIILAGNEFKRGIMKAISEKYGVESEACGIVLSLPVDGVAGLAGSLDNEE